MFTSFVRRTLATASLGALLFSGTASAQSGISEEVYEKLDVFASVFERVRASYVEPVTETEVIEAAINGMLMSLDPHSSYLPKEAFDDMKETTKGKFGGLGIEVTMDAGVVKVVAPIDDTPAAKAGIEAGDYIIRIDDEEVQGMTLREAVDKMRGEVGTEIDLRVFRESELKTIDVHITRAVITVKPVKHRVERENIGYLRITTFNEQVDQTIRKAINEMEKEAKEHGGLAGLVLDLRNNPGGLLGQAVAAADAFLVEGEIVSTRGREEDQSQRYNARKGDLMKGKPIVVLINGGSASASEIVAGALQDHKRAVIIGTKSFGKGSVQTLMQLPGGTGMRLTTALYYTPAGRSIQAEGIVPDVEVKPVKVEEIDVDGRRSEASLRGHISKPLKEVLDKEKKKNGKSDKDKDDKKAEEDKPLDYQLERALGMVKALSIYTKN